MNRLTHICVKTVRWTSLPLLLVILGFLLTGYMISGQIILRAIDEKQALALHKLLHYPLILLVAVHTIAAAFLTFRRWGWFKKATHVEDLQKTP